MATAAIPKLKPVEISPTILQYRVTPQEGKLANGRPVYVRRFFPNEDAQKTLQLPWLRKTDPFMPPYPYGKNHHFVEANEGLYGGVTIQSGNKISDGRNKGKTLRKWYPNVRVEKLRSEALNVELDIPTTARASRTIKKCGGLDQYVLGEKPARIKELGMLGWKLRWMVMKSKAMHETHRKQRRELKLPEASAVTATFSDAWADPLIRASLLEKMSVGWEELKRKDETFKKHLEHTLKWNEAKNIKMLRSLEIYDPLKIALPETVEEEESSRPRPARLSVE